MSDFVSWTAWLLDGMGDYTWGIGLGAFLYAGDWTIGLWWCVIGAVLMFLDGFFNTLADQLNT